ncbi:Mitochondrial metalloendopeptidase OMA1 [Heracleum sosnowskyi]|uniref:Mitochondrial metalloendopeptidase OMA1 n=1 Tax=Heracleum sosnowskyi TaxID=360622 RepID=A0AAD8JC03_9APIA|nr:Mitochondrial metalloendopeptidase OMA1 [Heracleum sosnowskyi]
MGLYKRSKLFLDFFKKYTSKITPNTSINHSIPNKNIKNPSLSGFNFGRLYGFSPISRKWGFEYGSKNNEMGVLMGKRYYYVDRNQVRHFRPRGPKNWFQNPRNIFIVTVLGGGVVITVYFGNLETIPYTKRTHFVLLPSRMEKTMGDSQFEEIKKQFKGKILPAIHPDSIRVRLIAKEIVEALQRGLRKEQVWTDVDYSSDNVGEKEIGGDQTLTVLTESAEGNWSKEDEILDDKWVQQSRKKGQERGVQSSISHLEGLNWEILVVDEPVVNAFCLPGGKIVVFTGLLRHFKTNEEIATIIGHEVGHVVARHGAEGITKNLWFAIIQLILYQFVMPDIVNSMSHLLLRLPFSRRMEMEADYIGLLLLASARYDPRVAPMVYEKLGKITGSSAMKDYLSTHPSGKKRAKLLAQAKVMEEAVAIYRETRMGHGGIEGFL